MRASRWLLSLLAATALAGCGGSAKTLQDLTKSTTSPVTSSPASTAATTTRATPTTTAGAPSTSASGAAGSSVAASSSWVPAAGNLTGMASECGNLSLVSARPDRDTVIASVSQHGLWSTSTGAASWTALGQAGGAAITNRGSSIVYDPARADTFWESGIYNGGGLYRTDDGGATFRQLGDITHVDGVSVDVADPDRRTLLVGLHEQTGVLRSHDGGQTWTKISTTLPVGVGFTSSPFVIDSRTFLVGTNKEQNAGVFRTTDDGATWTQVYKGAVIGQPLLTKGGKLFWIVDGSGAVIASADGGANWSTAARPGTVDPLAPNLVELPGGGLAAVGNLAIIASKDEGQTWSRVSPTMPYRPVGMTFSPLGQAFYIWYFTCDRKGDNAVPADAVMRLGVTSA